MGEGLRPRESLTASPETRAPGALSHFKSRPLFSLIVVFAEVTAGS
jgi:hypothetical protein